MKVKVCGLRELSDVEAVAAIGADLMGFIFHAPSPRNALGIARATVEAARGRAIGVFVNPDVETVTRRCGDLGIGTVQLHGSESPSLGERLRCRGFEVVKAFGVGERIDSRTLGEWQGIAGMFIFDTRCAAHGGSGRKFDWRVLEDYVLPVPFLLSGGVGPDDADALPRHGMMAGVDVNSRFELSPGRKDIEKLRLFIERIRGKQ